MINATLRIALGLPLAVALIAMFAIALVVEGLTGLSKVCPHGERQP